MTTTQALLREWVRYDQDTGLFTWARDLKNGRKSGSAAGSTGYFAGIPRRVLCINGKQYFASRAAWIYCNGDLASNVLIDHINGNPLDNRLCNLRIASAAQNSWKVMHKSGEKFKKGVNKLAKGRYRASIHNEGKSILLGTWDTEAEAHAAYMGAAAVLHGDFWIGNRPKPA